MSDRPSEQPNDEPRGLGCTAVVRQLLRESITLPAMPKPDQVKLGQIWRHRGLQGRSLVVVRIEYKKGSNPATFREVVPWAIFRRGHQQPVDDMLSDRSSWTFHGSAF